MAGDRDDIGSAGKSVALEHRNTGEDGRRFSPSITRNREPVAEAFEQTMPLHGRILEIASGTGEHGAYLAERFTGLSWVYSDIDGISMESQRAWVGYGTKTGLKLDGPIIVDASADTWPGAEALAPFDGLFCANMVHIAPFEAAIGLMKGAGRLLSTGGKLFLYGPFARDGVIAPSNARFSEDLKRRDSSWGVRDLHREILPLALEAGLALDQVVEMPANNLSVIFSRSG
ncbi:DUF938 domain-containing protein [Henriciella sp.]|uniref:DUF938 domain-containing protein n=1 Tax=Henriciella sp. TaxID=1968823 RepID=UPI00260F26FF|nr:DUF938 domain-containing protein [Henriciella sp.]